MLTEHSSEESDIKKKILNELKELEAIPYGTLRYGKILCPSRNHFVRKIERIEYFVITLNTPESISCARNLQSIKYNDVRYLNDREIQKEFQYCGLSESMVSIVDRIQMHVKSIL